MPQLGFPSSGRRAGFAASIDAAIALKTLRRWVILMVTVHRAHGFRFVIFVNDHSPPHVPVFGKGGEAKIILDGSEGIKLDWVAGISRGDLRRVLQEVERERNGLIAMWRTIHER